MEPNVVQEPKPQAPSLEPYLPAGVRTTFQAEAPEHRAWHLTPPPLHDQEDRLAHLAATGPARPGQEGWYRQDVADVLCDVAAWSYAGVEAFIRELEHRSIVAPRTPCREVSVRNEAMLVVGTAFLVRSGAVGVVSFRGTEPRNTINFLTDATVEPKPFLSMGQVHGGFHRNLRAVWTDVAEWIEQQQQSGMTSLYFTGHSLGGAMAVLAAATLFGDERFARWQPLLKGVYTFGQPPVGDAVFAQSCEERFGKLHFRHVYGHDLVPRLPPRSTGHFRHSGKEYVGGLEGWRPRSKAIEQAYTALWSLPVGLAAWIFRQFPVLRWIRLPYSVDDHSPNRYLEAFRATRETA